MDEMRTTFHNEDRRQYNCKITVPIALAFCQKYGIKMECFNPLMMNIAQIIDLCFECTRSTKTETMGETREEFLAGLEGPSFSEAQECTTNAMVLFSLRTLPPEQAQMLKKEVERLQEVAKSLEEDHNDQSRSQEENGTGVMSSESVVQ